MIDFYTPPTSHGWTTSIEVEDDAPPDAVEPIPRVELERKEDWKLLP